MPFIALLFLILLANPFTLNGEESVGKIVLRHTIPDLVIVELDTEENGEGTSSSYTPDLSDLRELLGFEMENAVKLRNLSTNVPVVLKFRNLGWGVPAGYPQVEGTKRGRGNQGNLKLRVSSVSAAKGVISAATGFQNKYRAVTDTGESVIFLGGINGQGKKVGLSGGEVEIDAQIDFDPVYDVPGNYEVTLELLIAPQI